MIHAERFKVVCIPCKALYKCSARLYPQSRCLLSLPSHIPSIFHIRSRYVRSSHEWHKSAQRAFILLVDSLPPTDVILNLPSWSFACSFSRRTCLMMTVTVIAFTMFFLTLQYLTATRANARSLCAGSPYSERCLHASKICFR